MTLLKEALLRFLLLCVKGTPRGLSALLCSLVYLLAQPFVARERRKIARNIDTILGIPSGSQESHDFQNKVFKHQLASSFESFKSGFKHDLIEIEGFEELRRKLLANLADGRGLVLTTGHIGSWELAGYYTALATSGKFTALAKPSKLEAATPLLEEYRLRMLTKTLWTNQPSLLKTMARLLKEGEALGFVMDQRPDSRKGPIANFMGQPTTFVVGPAWASIHCGSPVVGVYCVRLAPWRYRLICTEILPASHNVTDVGVMTQMMAAEIERVIRLYPEQWVWNYNRWKFK